ncbi:MAG: hydrogenase maturation peptidase HycI [candidate division WOR-3 bacterium]
MPEGLFNILSKEIKNAQRICILGAGNVQKGDDGAGPMVIQILKEKIKMPKTENILLIDGGEVPENFTGEIRKFQPELVIIFDACISGKKPGSIYLINPERIIANDISTHRLPLSMFVKFLEETMTTRVIVIGIEPNNLNFGVEISPEVNQAVKTLTSFFTEILKNLNY